LLVAFRHALRLMETRLNWSRDEDDQ